MTTYPPTPEVAMLAEISFKGNVTPHSWYNFIKRPNGKPNTTAIILLSEIIFWYRPVETRDEQTGHLIGLARKFKADKLQRSYDSFAEQFGFTKRQVKDALKYLADLGVIDLDFRHITIQNGRRLPNVLFIGINPDKVREITHPRALDMLQNNVTYPTPECQTNTEITTEITTEDIGASAPIADANDEEPSPDSSTAEKEQQEEASGIEEKSGAQEKKQEALPGMPTLEPETEGEHEFFEVVGLEFAAKGRRRPRQWPNTVVKDRFLDAATKLNGGVGDATRAAFAAGIGDIPRLVAYIGGIVRGQERDKATAEGRVYVSDEGTRVIEL